MNFKEINRTVISFYSEFHAVFSIIDKKFEQLDEKGNYDISTLREIITDLRNYHVDCYKSCSLISEPNDTFDRLNERIAEINQDFSEYVAIVKEVQRNVHDSLVRGSQWDGQGIWIEIITRILNQLSSSLSISKSQETSYYATVRILRELVADCSISIRGLGPLFPWSSGTAAFSQLDEGEQLVLLINQSILIDRMYFSLQLLATTLNQLNKIIDSFDELDWSVYYVAGFLNFKIHQYSCARKYFLKVSSREDLKNSTVLQKQKHYFHSSLLIAYSYEYGHEFEKAVKTIATSPENINRILNDIPFETIDSSFSDIMERICKASTENQHSLFSQYFSSFSKFIQQASRRSNDNVTILEMQLEILHAFAHCLNEYSIQGRIQSENKKKINFGKLIKLARRVMFQIATFRPEYWTCYATIHGECQDYYQALTELDVAQKKLANNRNGVWKESLVAEICFFKYYFNLLCDRPSNAEKNYFEAYCEKYDDDDAKCYLRIFEFRDKLRRYISALYNDVNQLGEDEPFTENNILQIDSALQKDYEELCNMEPTLYMNANVHAELLFMQRAYICIKCLRDYFISPSANKLLILRNACYRFNSVRRELGLPSFNNNSINKRFATRLPKVVENAFSVGKVSVLNSLFSSDSIFILAPISGSVVYQYQTGNIAELFDCSSILPPVATEQEIDILEVATKLFELYNQLPAIYGQPEMINVDWENLRKYTNVVYYWCDTVPAQVIVAKDGSQSYVRHIENVESFMIAMTEAKKIFDSNTHRRPCSNQQFRRKYPDLRCTLQKYELPWLEVINEKTKHQFFYIAWDDGIENTTDKNSKKCFIVPFTSENRHALHSFLRNISIEYSQFDYGYSNISDNDDATDDCFEESIKFEEMAKEIITLAKAKKRTIQHKRDDAERQYASYTKKSNPNALAIRKKRDEYDSLISEIDEIIFNTSQGSSGVKRTTLQNYKDILSRIAEF